MIKQKSLKINASLSLINTFISMVFPLITYPYVSRILGVENIGAVNFGNSILEYFNLIAAFGISNFAVRTGAGIRDDKAKINKFASQIFTLFTITTSIAFLLLAVTLFLPTKITQYRNIILIQSLTLISLPMSLDWLYSIFEDFAVITYRNLIAKVVSIIAIFSFVKNTNDVLIYVLITSCATVASNIYNFIYSRKYVKLRIVKSTGWSLYKKSLFIFFINSIASTIYLNSDKTMLGFMCGDTSVGLYTTATNIYTIFKRIVGAAVLAMIPRMAYYAENDRKSFNSLLTKTLKVAVLITLPITAGLIVLRNDIVYIISGKGYEAAQSSLCILSCALIFATIANIYANGVLISIKRERYLMRCTLTSALLNFALNFFFIPFFAQDGAAITTLIAEITMAAMSIYYGRTKDRIVKISKTIVHAFIGSLCIFAVGALLINALTSCNILVRDLLIFVISVFLYSMVLLICKEDIIYSFILRIKKVIDKTGKNKIENPIETNNNREGQRDKYIDILRGIGIISVVLGHSSNTDFYWNQNIDYLRRFVYVYHLAIFFFASGCLYKTKTTINYWRGIIKNQYLKFVITEFLSLTLIPFWVKLNVIEPLGHTEVIHRIIYIFMFQSEGVLVGPMWFMTYFFIGSIIYHFCDKFVLLFPKSNYYLAKGSIAIVVSISGIILAFKGISLPFWIQYGMSIQFIVFFGEYIYQNNAKLLKIFKNNYLFIPTAFIIICLLLITGEQVELSKNLLFGYWGYIPILIVGILFCTSFASVIEKFRTLSKIVSYFGQNSYWIMAFHFWGFKLIDGIIGMIYGEKVDVISITPFSFPYLRIVYFMVGILFPIGLNWLCKTVCSKLRIRV